ncbi:hypothetical protein FHS19_003091 [Paenibacillus rhizosphaerae]|uniref:SLH domain-containing protein n=1 Tax=Paenibacillus rhizosphaerae TaxID=297318 RepID=A0A839TUT1_9BACL|nr:S-layer homology domain-containing protein [Paenibacillus rhizosphaerae]MBB3128437.1 hypothetical protein [Paenibacillus rhizosphaerae]
MKSTFKMITLSTAVTLTLGLAGQQLASAAAFKDLNNVPDKEKIISLQNSGLINGISIDLFGPYKPLSEVEGVQLIVKAAGLNLDMVRFVKEPKASDYFPNANDHAWYSQALIIAAVNGLDIPADLKPNQKLTREEFTHELIHAFEISGQLPKLKPVVVDFKDQDQVKTEYSGSIQRALKYGVVKLDANENFNPKRVITRAEAAVEISNMLTYLKAHPAPGTAVNETLTAEQAVQLIKQVAGPDADLQIKIDPKSEMSRESFTYLLIHTLQTSGQLPMINVIPVEIKDQSQMDISNSGAVQTAIALDFVTLDEDGNFIPKAAITRTAATDIVNRVAEFFKAHPAPDLENKILTAEQAVELIKKAAGPDADLQIKIDPSSEMSRESFTYLLIHTLQTSGQLPMINVIPVEIKDNDKIDILNSGAIQTAISLNIVKLDAEGNFHPKEGVTRGDANAMVNRVHEIIKKFPDHQ